MRAMTRKLNPGDYDWNDAAIARLTELWMSGYSSGECARHLGISRSSAIGKVNRLGLLGRERPSTVRLALAPARNLLRTEQPVSKPKKPPKKPKRPPKTPDRFFAEFAAKPPPPPPPPAPPTGSFDLLELRNGHCRWPSDGDGPRWTFCGAPQAFDSSYCAEHHAMAHARGSQRDYDRQAEQALAGKLFTSRAGVME
jgi:hypothetical protein